MVRVKVLLVYGAGSGLGKSTLAREAAELLAARGIARRVVTEEDAPVGFFAPYAARCAEGCGNDTAVLLGCALAFLEGCRRFHGVTIVDSILPCWDWLASAGCPAAEIEEFTGQLVEELAGLTTGLVVVEGDLAKALDRAIGERGERWARDLARRRSGGDDLVSLVAYFARLRAVTAAMLPAWPGPHLALDTDRSLAASTKLLGDWLDEVVGSNGTRDEGSRRPTD